MLGEVKLPPEGPVIHFQRGMGRLPKSVSSSNAPLVTLPWGSAGSHQAPRRCVSFASFKKSAQGCFFSPVWQRPGNLPILVQAASSQWVGPAHNFLGCPQMWLASPYPLPAASWTRWHLEKGITRRDPWGGGQINSHGVTPARDMGYEVIASPSALCRQK